MKKLALLAVLVVAALSTNTAVAQFPGGCGWGNYYGWGYANPAGYYDYNGRVPPYFAVHPPVYYSGQIQRIPYGASPFAAGPQTEPARFGAGAMSDSNSASTAAGQMIVNPHFKGTQGKSTQSQAPGTASPLATGVMIVNPHYVPTTRVASR
jgi:hypothetical protein